MSLVERLGLDVPVVGAGLGGGLSTADLTTAIGRAGGLGQVGMAPVERMREEVRRHRDAGDAGPVAVNLLLPFARRAHWEMAGLADLVVTFWGPPRRRSAGPWVHQCGSVDEARAAAHAGADAVIAQGVEAGGHVRGSTPALELTARIRAALGPDLPVWTAGGIAERADVEEALAAGAEAVVVGTRFLLTRECAAHPGYQQRLLEADATVLTDLFGAGWPGAHRVVRNAATERWLRDADVVRPWLGRTQRATAPLLARLPLGLSKRAARVQRPGFPLLTPLPPTVGDPASLVDAGALYAGQCVSRIDTLRAATDVVADLAGARPDK